MSKKQGYDCRQDLADHINLVGQNLKRVSQVLLHRYRNKTTPIGEVQQMAYMIVLRANTHDLSKFSKHEKPYYDELTPLLRGSSIGSQDYKDNLKKLGVALTHHYAENRHHPQHFSNGIAGMNLVDFAEMFCDWCASTERHDSGDIHISIECQQERFGYCDTIKTLMHNTARGLGMGRKHNDGHQYHLKTSGNTVGRYATGFSGMSIITIIEQFLIWVHEAKTGGLVIADYVEECCRDSVAGPIITSMFVNTVEELALD